MPDILATRMTRRGVARFGVAVSPLLVSGATPSFSGAQATPAATPGVAEASPETVYSVQFQHPEKLYFYLPGFQDENVRAAIHGLDIATYRAIRESFDAAAHEAAMGLLADDTVATLVAALPFAPGEVVAAVGESDTDDLQSWFEILRHLVTMQRPDDGITFVNQGISGRNTAELLGHIGVALASEPDWLFCLLGGNDILRNGPDATKTEISIEETERNLTEMRRLATAGSAVRWVWLARPPIDEARATTFPGFQMGNISFRNADVERLNAFVTRQPEPVVDLSAAFGDPSTDLLGPDGVHASLEGHAAIARAVVERLAIP